MQFNKEEKYIPHVIFKLARLENISNLWDNKVWKI